MSKEWYYNQDDAPCGPVDEPEIVRLIQSGELPPGVLVCFKGGSEWLPAHQYICFKVEAHPKKKAPEQAASVTVPKPASAGTSQTPGQTSIQPKTSGLAIASLVCGILGMCLWVPGMIGIVLGIKAMRQINGSAGAVTGQGLAIGGLIVSGISMVVGLGISASLLLPTLAKAKVKANRMKCASNLSIINKAFIDFASEIDGNAPHLYGKFIPGSGDNLAKAMGYADRHDPYQCKRWCNAFALRQSLVYYRSLASPLDPKVIAAQRRYDVKTFAEYGDRTDLWHDPKLQSYAIAMQGDTLAPETVCALTRNIWSASRDERRKYIQNNGGRNDGDVWKYPSGDRPWFAHVGYHANLRSVGGRQQFPEHMFYGLGSAAFSMGSGKKHDYRKDQANWVTSGGSASQGSAIEFNDQLMRAKDNYKEGQAIAPGLNLTVLRPAQDGPNPAGGGEFIR